MSTIPIPTTLDEAVDQLVATMSDEQRTAYAATDEHFPGRGGFGSGMAMRNDWGLWHHETPISKWLLARRIYHGDDASLVIYRAVWRRLHQLPIDDTWMAEQAAYYEAFWRDSAGLTWDMQPIPGRAPRESMTLRVDKTGKVTYDPLT